MEPSPSRAPRAVLFDAYGTLFDVYSIGAAAERLFPGDGERLAVLWRDKQIEYTRLTLDERPAAQLSRLHARRPALRGAPLRPAARRRRRARADGRLRAPRAFPENRAVLAELRRRGVRAGILSNGDPDMLEAVVRNAGFAELLDPVLSVEGTGRFKTDPATYALGTARARPARRRGAVRLEQLLGRDRRDLVRLHDALDQSLRPAARRARRAVRRASARSCADVLDFPSPSEGPSP